MHSSLEQPPTKTKDIHPGHEGLDLRAFVRDLEALRKELREQAGEDDIVHLRKMQRWGRTATALGLATAWMAPNPISAGLLSLGKFTRWTMMAHHVMHRGYDKVPGIPPEYTSKVFARGRRRFIDWFDWMLPEAWEIEHNHLHHYRLGEEADPDLVERNSDWLRKTNWPPAVKKALVFVLASSWKWIYYAPSTLSELHTAQARRAGTPLPNLKGEVELSGWNPLDPRGRELWTKSLLPYAGWNFMAIPALYSPLGPIAVSNVLINQIFAEIITNLHSFAVIVTNHAGDDMMRFDNAIGEREEFYLRQIQGSVNFDLGSDFVDFLHGFLNYQIEHHLFPDMTMLQYRKAQPRVEALCKQYGIPYVKQSVWKRLGKTVDVMIGAADMKRER